MDLPPKAARRFEELARERLPLLEELGLLGGYPEDRIEVTIEKIRRLRRIVEGMATNESDSEGVRRNDEIWEKLLRSSDLGAEMCKIVRHEIAADNGLACAAYLARAKQNVLVLEARERIGGACTLEETWPGFRVSPVRVPRGPPASPRDRGARDGNAWLPVDARGSGAVHPLPKPRSEGSRLGTWTGSARCER